MAQWCITYCDQIIDNPCWEHMSLDTRLTHKNGVMNLMYPLVNIQKTVEKSTSLIGKSTVSGPSSIAMLNYQNVTCVALFSVAVSKKNVLWFLIAFSSSVPQIMVVAWPLLAGFKPMCRRNAPAAGWLNDQLTYVYLVKTSLSGETVFFVRSSSFNGCLPVKKVTHFMFAYDNPRVMVSESL